MPFTGSFSAQPGDDKLIARMKPSFREILTAEGSYMAIAANLGIALGTVRSRLHRARAALVELREIEAAKRHQERTADHV